MFAGRPTKPRRRRKQTILAIGRVVPHALPLHRFLAHLLTARVRGARFAVAPVPITLVRAGGFARPWRQPRSTGNAVIRSTVDEQTVASRVGVARARAGNMLLTALASIAMALPPTIGHRVARGHGSQRSIIVAVHTRSAIPSTH